MLDAECGGSGILAICFCQGLSPPTSWQPQRQGWRTLPIGWNLRHSLVTLNLAWISLL